MHIAWVKDGVELVGRAVQAFVASEVVPGGEEDGMMEKTSAPKPLWRGGCWLQQPFSQRLCSLAGQVCMNRMRASVADALLWTLQWTKLVWLALFCQRVVPLHAGFLM